MALSCFPGLLKPECRIMSLCTVSRCILPFQTRSTCQHSPAAVAPRIRVLKLHVYVLGCLGDPTQSLRKPAPKMGFVWFCMVLLPSNGICYGPCKRSIKIIDSLVLPIRGAFPGFLPWKKQHLDHLEFDSKV